MFEWWLELAWPVIVALLGVYIARLALTQAWQPGRQPVVGLQKLSPTSNRRLASGLYVIGATALTIGYSWLASLPSVLMIAAAAWSSLANSSQPQRNFDTARRLDRLILLAGGGSLVLMVTPDYWRSVLLAVSLLVVAMRLLVSIQINWRRWQPSRQRLSDTPTVSILVPARNEAAVIGHTIETLLALDYPAYEIIILNDRSRDSTRLVLEQFADAGLQILDGQPPPAGWTGKAYACWQLAKAASGQYLLFLDADTVLHPEALTWLVSQAQSSGATVLSAAGTQIPTHPWEQLLLPLASFWRLALPYDWLERYLPNHQPTASTCLLITRAGYDRLGGHKQFKSSLVEATQFAQAAGTGYRFVMAPELIESRRVNSVLDTVNRYRRLLYPWLQYDYVQAVLAVVLILAVQLGPLGLLLASLQGQQVIAILLLAATILVTMAARLLSAYYMREAAWSAILNPLAHLLLTALIIASVVVHERHRVTWRGSRVPAVTG